MGGGPGLPSLNGGQWKDVVKGPFLDGGWVSLGAKPEAIQKRGRDRQAFKEAMIKIGMDLPKSFYAYYIGIEALGGLAKKG